MFGDGAPYIYISAYTTCIHVLPEPNFGNMHWQYYQKAIAAYFAASNALAVQAQQQPFTLPGDGGKVLPFKIGD